MLILW
jgi:hypothetical protein